MKELNTEAATGGFRSKKMFLQISQNSQENVLSASPATLLKKTLIQVFSCGFCEIFNSTYFEEHLWKTASENKHLNMKYIRPVYSVTSFN